MILYVVRKETKHLLYLVVITRKKITKNKTYASGIKINSLRRTLSIKDTPKMGMVPQGEADAVSFKQLLQLPVIKRLLRN